MLANTGSKSKSKNATIGLIDMFYAIIKLFLVNMPIL